MKNRNAIGLVITAVAAILVIAFWTRSGTGGDEAKPSKETVVSPSVGAPFDSVAKIPGTNIAFAYPAKGFYDKGAKVTYSGADVPSGSRGAAYVEPTDTYDSSRGSEHVTLSVIVNTADEQALEQVVARIRQGETPDAVHARNGKVTRINGREFFVYKIEEDVTVWRGLTVGPEGLVSASLAYKPGGSTADENEELLGEILARLRVE